VLLVVVNVQLAARAGALEGGHGVAHGVDGDPVVGLGDPEEHRQVAERAGRQAVGAGRPEQRAGENGRRAVGLRAPRQVLSDDARALREAHERDGGQRAPVAAGRRDRGLDGLQRPV